MEREREREGEGEREREKERERLIVFLTALNRFILFAFSIRGLFALKTFI